MEPLPARPSGQPVGPQRARVTRARAHNVGGRTTMQDNTQDPQDAHTQDQDTRDDTQARPSVTTFIIMKDEKGGHGLSLDAIPGPVLTTLVVPMFRAYVDVPSEGYGDIDPDSYIAPRKIITAFLDMNQPTDVAGTWWVGKLPDTDDPYAYGSALRLERFQVDYVLNIIG
jgi:hypothetical protein